MELNDKDLRRMKWEKKTCGDRGKQEKGYRNQRDQDDSEFIEKYGLSAYAEYNNIEDEDNKHN